jgi:hypothetical protein
VFADLGGEAMQEHLKGAKLAAARKADGIAEYGQGWTDDMFMASAILARVGTHRSIATRSTPPPQLLVDYAGAHVQRPRWHLHPCDRCPFAWVVAMGNVVSPALGLIESVDRPAENHRVVCTTVDDLSPPHDGAEGRRLARAAHGVKS